MRRNPFPTLAHSEKCVRSFAAALIAGTGLVGGCALQPAYVQPAAPVAATFPAGDAYKPPTTASGRTTLPASDIGWRDVLTDPRLQRVVEIGLKNNRDLRIAALNVAQVQAQYRIQRAELFPQINAAAGLSGSRTPAGVSLINQAFVQRVYSADLSASWEIDFFGRLRSLSEEALQQYFATAQARKATEILLVSQIADQYLTLLSYEQLVAVTERTLESAQASYQLTSLQFRTGTGTELSLREAETVVEQAKANYSAQIRGRAQAENALVLLLGQALPAELPPAVPLDEQTILADIPAGLPSDLLARRPDIMQAEAVLRAANASIGAARAAFFPSISLTGDFGTASSALDKLFKAGSKEWSFAPSVTAPIFTAGSLQASLDVAKLQKEINIAQYEKTIQTAFREVADGLAARGTFDEQVASQERFTQAQQRRLDLSIMRFRSGVDPYLTVLTAQTDLYNAQQTLVSLRLARLTNLVDLYRALGGGWIERTGDAPRIPEDVGATRSAGREGGAADKVAEVSGEHR
jgi:multidrug efflux system outer membrane protein